MRYYDCSSCGGVRQAHCACGSCGWRPGEPLTVHGWRRLVAKLEKKLAKAENTIEGFCRAVKK